MATGTPEGTRHLRPQERPVSGSNEVAGDGADPARDLLGAEGIREVLPKRVEAELWARGRRGSGGWGEGAWGSHR